jgi:transposase-like protein
VASERLSDEDLLQLRAQGMSVSEIARQAGVSRQAIQERLRRLRDRGSPAVEDDPGDASEESAEVIAGVVAPTLERVTLSVPKAYAVIYDYAHAAGYVGTYGEWLAELVGRWLDEHGFGLAVFDPGAAPQGAAVLRLAPLAAGLTAESPEDAT